MLNEMRDQIENSIRYMISEDQISNQENVNDECIKKNIESSDLMELRGNTQIRIYIFKLQRTC